MAGSTVLILDGNQRSALAATRSLGRRGIPVVVGDEADRCLAGSSRFREGSFRYPSPYLEAEPFIEAVRAQCESLDVGVVLPMTDVTTHVLLQHREKFGFAVPFPALESYEALTDKGRLFQLASQLDVSIPRTRQVSSAEELDDAIAHLCYPVVLKPCRSRLRQDGEWIATTVEYANSEVELRRAVAETEYLRRSPFLIQEYIPGSGQGVFALYDRGTPVAFFAHRRLRERPPWGGVSVLSESVEVDPSMKRMAREILDRVCWHGVAMVEFRVTDDGRPYLMEVNARFWGSLQLAVDAGVDFPLLLYRLAVGEPVEAVDDYRVGVRSRWLLGDLDHLYLTLKKRARERGTVSSRWKAVLRFLNVWQHDTRFEVNRWEDPRPFLFEIGSYLRGLC